MNDPRPIDPAWNSYTRDDGGIDSATQMVSGDMLIPEQGFAYIEEWSQCRAGPVYRKVPLTTLIAQRMANRAL